MPKFDVDVQLSGLSGNAYAIMGSVTTAIKRAGGSNIECDQFRTEATSGDYDNLLQTCIRWVNVR
jgi:hypothetical protein